MSTFQFQRWKKVNCMDKDINKSFVMAERLRELREAQKLSHEKLSKTLSEKYGIKISSDSLMNYEFSKGGHSKTFKNMGMRVEYLYCLADFYGVSTDYILGISDVKSPDPSLQAVVEYTGIPEDALHAFRKCLTMYTAMKQPNDEIKKAVKDGATTVIEEPNEPFIEHLYDDVAQQYASIFDMIVEFMRYSAPDSLHWYYLRDMAKSHFNFVSLQKECSDVPEWYGDPQKKELDYALFLCQQNYIEYCKHLAKSE